MGSSHYPLPPHPTFSSGRACCSASAVSVSDNATTQVLPASLAAGEVGEMEHHERERRARPAASREFLLSEFDEGAAIEDAGERIGCREAAGFFVGALLVHQQEGERAGDDERVGAEVK